MKINPLFQSEIVSRYVSGATSVPQKTETVKQASCDTVELSSSAQNYAQLLRNTRSALEESESGESAHVDEIQSKLEKGTYQVSNDDIVDALAGYGDIPQYC